MSHRPIYQRAVSLLRRAKLLGLFDALRCYGLKPSSLVSRRAFQRKHGAVALPPDALAYDAYGFLNWEQYWTSGLETARFLREILLGEFTDPQPRRLLEWGCGPARIVRHLPEVLGASGNWQIAACDYNPATIRWCRDNVPGVTFAENGLAPPLPFEAQRFDAVYCISVFTHLSEANQRAWVAELARILREGGLLIASFHGDATRAFLLAPERHRYESGQVVVRADVPEGKRTFAAYHPPAYVRALLSPAFEILSRQTSPVRSLGAQDLYVARKL